MVKKFTQGFVEQTFNDEGECIHQRFVAEGKVLSQTDEGDFIETNENSFPFVMLQPEEGIPALKALPSVQEEFYSPFTLSVVAFTSVFFADLRIGDKFAYQGNVYEKITNMRAERDNGVYQIPLDAEVYGS